MNKPFLQLDETGTYVQGVGYAAEIPDGAIPAPEGVNPQSLAGHYLVDGELTPRPAVPAPAAIEGGGYSLGPLPLGCMVLVIDLIGAETMKEFTVEAEGMAYEFDLPDAGRYTVEVDPPAPWVASKYHIEVA